MPYRFIPFTDQTFYHVYNRGVEKRIIFLDERDYRRFLQTLYHYQFDKPIPSFSKKKNLDSYDFTQNPQIVEIIAYCFMPNHFHLLIKQLKEDGVSEFISRVLNSYTKYFNTKHKRVGPLLQGTFKAITIEDDMQLIHVSRYIHLNPYVSNLTKDLDNYFYSSFPDYIDKTQGKICNKKPILSLFKNPADYKEFVSGHSDYAKELEIMKHLLMEEE
ncbi:MAG: transposase [Candidatus Daviesbacteria bacterium]|nr:transposase [Candidatus Daviesbacteria bacterium]